MENPLSVSKDGLKVKPEIMEKEKLYHTVLGEKILLVFKDSQDVLNCYEIEERELVEKAKTLPDGDIEQMLEAYIQTNIPREDQA